MRVSSPILAVSGERRDGGLFDTEDQAGAASSRGLLPAIAEADAGSSPKRRSGTIERPAKVARPTEEVAEEVNDPAENVAAADVIELCVRQRARSGTGPLDVLHCLLLFWNRADHSASDGETMPQHVSHQL